jgi:hypothetical protein
MGTMNNGATLGSDALRVVFERAGDRFSHEIIWAAGNDCHGRLASQEGTADEAWPKSPALQSLHVETRADRQQMIMLVGMAGRSHWSMTVEADETRDRLIFDVACRVHERPDWLGSTYSMPMENIRPGTISNLSVAAWCGEQLQDEITVQIDDAIGNVRIPASVNDKVAAQTVRWRYAIEVRK